MTRSGTWCAVQGMIQRDLMLTLRRLTDVMTTLLFFIIVVSLFPFGVGSDMNILRLIAPGVVWVAALLASMLALGRLFSSDYNDGTLEQLVLAPHPLSLLILGKVLAHWVATGLPLALIAPLLALQYDVPEHAIGVLVITLLLGTPVLSLIGAIGAALTLGLRGGGVLISLLVLPLYVPILIFGAGAVDAAISGVSVQAHFSLLGAFLVLAVIFAPWAISAALKISIE